MSVPPQAIHESSRTTSPARPVPSVYQTEDRRLLLRGGELDGHRWVGVIGVGHRVVVGPGPWAASHVYVVTGEEVPDGDGNPENIAVPASFA
jgi:hypothetical protein